MTARAGWDPPERCPQCGGLLEVDIGWQVDLTDADLGLMEVELTCLTCDYRRTTYA